MGKERISVSLSSAELNHLHKVRMDLVREHKPAGVGDAVRHLIQADQQRCERLAATAAAAEVVHAPS